MERFGFVGLPNAGKSSLYNALAGGGALAAPYAFATVDPNVGVAKVPDHRLALLAEMSRTKVVIPASVQFVDIAGLVEGAAQGEGLGNRFLAHIREVDAIVFVLRAFHDDDVPGSSDPVEQLSTLEVELVYADLESLEKQVDKRRKAARADKTLADEVAAMETAIGLLQAGTPLYRGDLDAGTRALLRPFFLLTAKPALALVNLDEEQLEDPEPHLAGVRAAFGVDADDHVLGLCIQLEAEAAMLDEGSRAEMLEALGLGEGALPTLPAHRLPDAGPAHVLHHRGEGDPGLDLPGRLPGAPGRRRHPHRLRTGVHPGRGDPLGRAPGDRVVVQGPRRGQAAGRGQGLRGGRR